MISLPNDLNARDQETMRSTVAFLEGRLEEKETIEWAASLGPSEVAKRRAILRLLDRKDGINLQEPWRFAWRLIEESWKHPIRGDDISDKYKYIVRKRLHSGDRSDALVSAIVDLVAPRLVMEPYPSRERQYRKFPKNPKTFHDMFSTSLKSVKSGEVVGPSLLGLEQVTEGGFIISLANALDAAVVHGLDLAKRIGWEKREHSELHRVYYVSECKSDEDKHEPDAFLRGTAPSIKLLYAVVSRLIDVDRPAALGFVSRWKQMDSQIHLRLWAAMSRDPRITPAAEVGEFLLHLGDEAFWDVSDYPEIAELRARRFHELDHAAQKAITKKIRKGPSRKFLRKKAKANNIEIKKNNIDIEKVRLYWIVRELKRIEVAGAILPPHDKTWLESNSGPFRELAEMNSILADVDERHSSNIHTIFPTPDHSLDSLVGIDRLKALEQALSRPSRGLDDDPASRARDWLSEKDNPLRVLKDMESSLNGGAEFPQVWECLGWIHSPAADQERVIGKEAVRRMLNLLETLSGDTLSKAIEGITHWLSSWQKYVVVQPNWPTVWLRAWPSAVETTNARQPPNAEPELNVNVWPNADEPQDLDILNPPAGKLVGVFLAAARPDLTRNPRPFDNPDLRTVRDHVIDASGQSGLIAKHRLIELLGYFLHTDKEWTQEHLIRPLRADNEDALALWRAVSRRTQFKDVLEIIGDDMVARTRDRQLGRDARRSLAFSLVVESLHALREQRQPAIEYVRIQQMIRSLDDEEVRTSCAEAVTLFVSEISSPTREALFQAVAKPFLQNVWPQERSLTSPGLSRRLAKLPALAHGSFAEAVDTVERFLVPFPCWSLLDYELHGNGNGTPKLAVIDDEAKADALLRLLDRTVGTAQDAVIPYGLGDALAQVRKVAPHLVQVPAYRRLETAARRTRW